MWILHFVDRNIAGELGQHIFNITSRQNFYKLNWSGRSGHQKKLSWLSDWHHFSATLWWESEVNVTFDSVCGAGDIDTSQRISSDWEVGWQHWKRMELGPLGRQKGQGIFHLPSLWLRGDCLKWASRSRSESCSPDPGSASIQADSSRVQAASKKNSDASLLLGSSHSSLWGARVVHTLWLVGDLYSTIETAWSSDRSCPERAPTASICFQSCEKLSKLHVWLLLVFISKVMQLGILVYKGHAKWSDF